MNTVQEAISISKIASLCENSSVGKLLPSALYVHICALNALDSQLQAYEQRARLSNPPIEGATLVKFHTDKPKISYLFYPDFDTDPHPALHKSIQVNLNTLEISYRDYRNTDSPPILHRKETFVTPDYPHYEQFAHLTRYEEALGLLNNAYFIGTRFDWLQRLREKGIELVGHLLACPVNATAGGKRVIQIERHKAALVRTDLSRPVKIALEAELFTPETSFFDYGCGYGGDIERIAQQGYISSGWDPYYRPDTPHTPAEIVNIGYVINVIEDLVERREALLNAWKLTRRVLIVSAQVLISDRAQNSIAYGDGVITRRNTFQKYYEQEELKVYIDQVLNVDSIPVGIGIYMVFRDEIEGESFRASRFRSRASTPRIRIEDKRFEDYSDLLAPLMAFVTERGRLPTKGELPEEEKIKAEFRTYKRAFRVILQVTDEEEWSAIADKRAQDLQLYLALSKFNTRPKKIQAFPPQVQQDIKGLFGSYKQACVYADLMLLSLRDLEEIETICKESPVGRKSKNSLLVHISALETLDPLLRLYEGCASRTIGRMENVTLIKFHTNKPKISYLYYPNFDRDPHPILQSSMHIDLRDLHVHYWDYPLDDNPPILHYKNELLNPDYPNYDKFAKLTQQEENWGLLEDLKAIHKLHGWLQCLEENCVIIDNKNHCLRWNKEANPYKVKALKAAVKSRKNKRRKAKEKLNSSNFKTEKEEKLTEQDI